MFQTFLRYLMYNGMESHINGKPKLTLWYNIVRVQNDEGRRVIVI